MASDDIGAFVAFAFGCAVADALLDVDAAAPPLPPDVGPVFGADPPEFPLPPPEPPRDPPLCGPPLPSGFLCERPNK